METLKSAQVPVEARLSSSVSTASVTTLPPRHSALVRVTHWIITLCFFALLLTGVEIVISHPRFYWGETGNVLTTPLFRLHIPSSRALVPTGYGYVLPDQNGWSRALHFEAAWIAVLNRIAVCNLRSVYRTFPERPTPSRRRSFPANALELIAKPLRFERPGEAGGLLVQRASAPHLCLRDFRSLPIGHLDRPGDVARVYLRLSGLSYSARRPPIGAHNSLLCLCRSRAVPACSCRDGLSCRIQQPHGAMITGRTAARKERT